MAKRCGTGLDSVILPIITTPSENSMAMTMMPIDEGSFRKRIFRYENTVAIIMSTDNEEYKSIGLSRE